MTYSVATLLGQHSSNPCRDTYLCSGSYKPWARSFPPITQLIVHTRVQGGGGGVGDQAGGNAITQANFETAFLPEYDDDSLRLQEQGNAPNERSYRLNSEEDGVTWFHTEISNVVLAAFKRYPHILQTSHEKPISESSRDDHTVDVAYSVYTGSDSSSSSSSMPRKHLVIGEFKRGLIAPGQWREGRLRSETQKNLSQELRG